MGGCLGKNTEPSTNKPTGDTNIHTTKTEETPKPDTKTKNESEESDSSTPRVKDTKKTDPPASTSTHSTTNTTGHKGTTTSKEPENSTKAATKASSKSVPVSSGGDSRKKIDKLFDQFKQENEQDEQDGDDGDEKIGAEGIEKFCQELEVDPEDPVLVAFSFHLNATELGAWKKEEFVPGLEKLKLDNMDSIKDYFNGTLRKELKNTATLKPIFKYAFDLGKNDPQQKTIGVEMAEGFLKMLLTGYPHATNFVEFLQQTGTKGLNHDQWTNLFEFCVTVNPTCSNYDETSAWPCILDEYVAR